MEDLELDIENLKAFVEKPIYTTEKDNLSALEQILVEEEEEIYPGIPGFGQFLPVSPPVPDDEGEFDFYHKEKSVASKGKKSSCKDHTSTVDEDVEHIKIPLPPNLMLFNKQGVLSNREKTLFSYFRRRRIMDFFQFMMSHLLANEPEQPLDFLRGLLDQCLLFRSGHADSAPLLFEDRHIDSIFRAMDPGRSGFITPEQYITGLKTMGIKEFETNPNVDEKTGLISQTEFFENAKLCLVEDLLDMIIVPPPPDPPEDVQYDVFDATVLARQKQMMNVESAKRYIEGLLDWQQRNKVLEECEEAKTAELPPLVPQEKFGNSFKPLKKIQDAYRPPTPLIRTNNKQL